MVVLLLCEYRSGSTNLANWFGTHKNFTVLYEPINCKNCKWYKGNEHPSKWNYLTEHLLVKEIYNPYINLYDLISTSDKTIILFRENESEQIQSYVNSLHTDRWHKPWVNKRIPSQKEIEQFTKYKSLFRETYLNKNYFKISYEELYHNNGLQKVLDYLDIGLENVNFPYGNRYRIFRDGHNSII